MKTRRLVGLIPVLTLLLVVGCKKPSAPAPQAAPTVSVVLPIKREVVEWDEYTGRLEAPESVEIRARVNGYLDQVHFKAGKPVKKGDLLFTIDRRPYKAELDRAIAEHERALNQAELAQSDAERAKRLIETKAISTEDYDNKTKTYASAQAVVRSAKAALTSAELNYEFTEIRSPIDGRIGRAFITEGNLISGGVGGTGASLLTTVVSQDPLYCYIDLDERSVLKYLALRKAGTRVSALDAEIPAEVALASEDDFPRKGFINFVDNKLDPTTGTVRCRAVIDNPDRTLGPGFFARLRLPGSGKYAALLVPDRALGADQAQKFVYVVNAEQKVEFRPVSVGPTIDGLRVVKSGLKPDDNVIVEGLLRVRPGIAVQAKSWQAVAGVAAK